jgi:hypothetical protein
VASGLWAAGMISIILSYLIIIIIIIIIVVVVVIICKGILDKRSYTYEDVQDKDNGPIVTGQSTLTYMSSKNVTST